MVIAAKTMQIVVQTTRPFSTRSAKTASGGILQGAMSQENLELFRAGVAAWNEGDYDAVVDMCHPEVEWSFSDRLPDATGQIRGKEEIRRFFQTFTGDWSEISIRADRIEDHGADVVADVAFVAKGRDGIEVSMRFIHVWTVRDGQIVRFRGFGSFEEALEAAG
jgi:ketosteroid isomerase-like protein